MKKILITYALLTVLLAVFSCATVSKEAPASTEAAASTEAEAPANPGDSTTAQADTEPSPEPDEGEFEDGPLAEIPKALTDPISGNERPAGPESPEGEELLLAEAEPQEEEPPFAQTEFEPPEDEPLLAQTVPEPPEEPPPVAAAPPEELSAPAQTPPPPLPTPPQTVTPPQTPPPPPLPTPSQTVTPVQAEPPPEEEPLIVAAAPEELPPAEPAPPQMPPQTTVPPPELPPRPAQVTPPPAEPPVSPPVAGTPPPGEPPAPEAGPSETESPAIALDPVPPEIPEISYPSTGVTGRNDGIVFSRIVRVTAGQYVEIPFRGTGWVYLGEIASRRGIAYDSRRLDSEGQNFLFRVELPGVYALKFFRQDFVRDFILNDHVQIIAGEGPETSGAGWFNPPVDGGRVLAEPRWPNTLDEASALGGGQRVSADTPPSPPATAQTSPAAPPPVPATPPAAAQTPPATTPPSAPVVTPSPAEVFSAEIPSGDYLTRAKEEFDAGRIVSAISLLDQFREIYPSGSDEAWWLYGQCYESNSPGRNILAALDYYRRLIRDFPQSSRCDEARRKISYLERYYINIR